MISQEADNTRQSEENIVLQEHHAVSAVSERAAAKRKEQKQDAKMGSTAVVRVSANSLWKGRTPDVDDGD